MYMQAHLYIDKYLLQNKQYQTNEQNNNTLTEKKREKKRL